VARKPQSLSFPEAAALPLTSITDWETLFQQFRMSSASNGTLLVVGGAGGVGSVLIQLAKQLTDMSVVATASRPESREWVTELGADAVVDHHDLVASTLAIAGGGVDFVFSAHSRGNINAYAEILLPFGEITAIDEPEGLDLAVLKAKSITWHWEMMFTRSMYEAADMIAQSREVGAGSAGPRGGQAGNRRAPDLGEDRPDAGVLSRFGPAMVGSGIQSLSGGRRGGRGGRTWRSGSPR
jgi:NADPH2:quinone reductase